MSLASFTELIRQTQTDSDSNALMAAVGELREELRALNEQLSATLKEVVAIADSRKASVALCEHMHALMTGYQQQRCP